MGKYNKLTERLLEQGYTVENYPKDKVHIASGCYSKMAIHLITFMVDLSTTGFTVMRLLIRPVVECM